MRIKIKGNKFDIDKKFFLNDSLGILILSLGATILFTPVIGAVVATCLFLRLVKEEFKK